MLAALDLFNNDPEPITADNYDKYYLDRKYNANKFGPFATELAFVLHKCAIQSGDDAMSEYKVHVLLNELPVKMMGGGALKCSEMKSSNNEMPNAYGSLCNFAHFKYQLLPFINQNSTEACSLF